MNKYSFLKSRVWQSFIEKNKDMPINQVLLSLKKNTNIDSKILAQQIVGRQIINKKVPSWSNKSELLFPPKIHIEQSSSEMTASYKSSLVSGKSFIDVTGGFGVDSFFLGKSFENGIHCELNQDLQFVASHNFKKLHANITSYSVDGIEFLKSSDTLFDLIYLDPSRRDEHNKKVIRLENYKPNVLNDLNSWISKGKRILLKTSPLLDIKQVINKLPYLSEIHIVAVDNECKELVFLYDRDVITQSPKLHCIDLKKQINFSFNLEQESQKSELSMPLTYLYEPNVSILKAGGFNSLSQTYNLKKLHNNTHLYTSDEKVSHFPGRMFEILKVVKLDKKQILAYLDCTAANISKRNFPLSVSEIRKKTGLKEGGNNYLFATTLLNQNRRVLICKKIH